MDLRHIRYFLAVAEQGSFSRAAAELSLTQPTLSRQIVGLERMLGQTLFERGPQGVALTSAGDALRVHGEELLRMEATTRRAVAIASPLPRTVVIGVAPTLSEAWLLRLLDGLGQDVSDVPLRLYEAFSIEQLRALQDGRIDIALTTQIPSKGLRSVRLLEHRFGLAIAPSHPLQSRPALRVADLAGLRVLARARDQAPPGHDRAIREVEEAGIDCLWEYTQFSVHTLACATAGGVDAVFCGEFTASQLPAWSWRPIGDLQTRMTLWLAWHDHATVGVQRVSGAIRTLVRPRAGTPPRAR